MAPGGVLPGSTGVMGVGSVAVALTALIAAAGSDTSVFVPSETELRVTTAAPRRTRTTTSGSTRRAGGVPVAQTDTLSVGTGARCRPPRVQCCASGTHDRGLPYGPRLLRLTYRTLPPPRRPSCQTREHPGEHQVSGLSRLGAGAPKMPSAAFSTVGIGPVSGSADGG